MMKRLMWRIIRYLGRPYPQLDMSRWRTTLIACGVVFLLFVMFEPFGVDSRMGMYKWVIIGGFMLISALAINLPGWVLPWVLGKEPFEERNWTVGRNIAYNVLILLLIAMCNYLFISLFFSSSGFRFSSFLIITMNTFFIGIFPVGLLTILTENRNMSRHLKEARNMNEHICGGKGVALQSACPPMDKVILPDGVKGTLEVKPEELLLAEADGNYVKIVCRQGEKVSLCSLRITMKQVEDAFSDCPFVQKCHRAFLVNLHCIEKVKGNSQGYRLVMKGWEEEIPVSRAYNKEMREKVARF